MEQYEEYRQAFQSAIGRVTTPAGESLDPIDVSEIRQAAYSIADYNPLWNDREYASRSRYGGIIAPPYFYYRVNGTVAASQPLPQGAGRGIIMAGADWRFFGVARPGDVISSSEKFVRSEEKTSKYSGKLLMNSAEVTYRNQRGEVLAIVTADLADFDVSAARERRAYMSADKGMPMFSDAQKRDIYRERIVNHIRGDVPRYFEDVVEGEEFGPVVQGPLWSEEIAFYISSRHWGPHDSVRAYPRPGTRVPDIFDENPWSDHLTNRQGETDRALPRAFDIGSQRISWLLRLASSWVGDDGELTRLSARLIRPLMVGDVSWYRGRVREKRVDGNQHLVDCDISGINQDGTVHVVGAFTAALPSKAT